nr:MAG TPA: hypothetical protein [Caudoviricetes sp.]
MATVFKFVASETPNILLISAFVNTLAELFPPATVLIIVPALIWGIFAILLDKSLFYTERREIYIMKITFNDASEMTIQSATIRTDGSLLIKTISATEDELRNTFQDEFRTKKITVTERETTVAEYEDYTNLNALVKYTGGILGVVMYREKESPMDRIDALEEHVDNLTEANKSREAENAELIATVDSILTDVLPALLGDGTEETNTENTVTK